MDDHSRIDAAPAATRMSRSLVPDVGFEDPDHRQDILSHIKNGVLPLKYAYTGTAAATHDTLAQSENYKRVAGAVHHEVATLLRAEIQPDAVRSLAEIGPGNGRRTSALLTEMHAAGYPCVRYLGLDFSRTLLDIAMTQIRQHTSAPPVVTTAAWDVESSRTDHLETWRVGTAPVLVCLVGQTLGNFEDMEKTLTNIRQSLRAGDRLLISVTACTATADEAAVEPYLSDTFRAAALEPFRAVGLQIDQLDFTMQYRDNTIVGEVCFRHETLVDDYIFDAGHRTRCFISRRFAPDMVEAVLSRSGWTHRHSELDSDGEHLAVVAVYA